MKNCLSLSSIIDNFIDTYELRIDFWWDCHHKLSLLRFFRTGIFSVFVIEQILSDVLDGVIGSVWILSYLSLASSVIACRRIGTTVLSRYCLTGIVLRSLFCVKPIFTSLILFMVLIKNLIIIWIYHEKNLSFVAVICLSNQLFAYFKDEASLYQDWYKALSTITFIWDKRLS